MTLYDELESIIGGGGQYAPGQSPFAVPTSSTPSLSDIGALNPTRPDNYLSLQRKYARDMPLMQAAGIPQSVIDSMLQFEVKRARQGQSPLSQKKTAALLKAAANKTAQTEPAERNPTDFLGNIAKDVGDIVGSIPKLPEIAVKEVLDLPNIGQRIEEGGGGIEGVLNAPGIRMLPGAYTAKNILTGNINEALSHPVMTVLDVAPITKALGVNAAIGRIPVGEAGTVAELGARAKTALSLTTGGRLARQTWGVDTRALSRIIGEKSIELLRSGTPQLRQWFDDRVSIIRQDNTAAEAAIDKAVSTGRTKTEAAARHAELYDAAEAGTVWDLPDLTDKERGALAQVFEGRDRLRQVPLDAQRLDQITMADGTPEIFTAKQAGKIHAKRAEVARREAFTGVRESIRSGVADLPDVFIRVQAALHDVSVPLSKHKSLVRGYIHALEANGYDVGPLTETLSSMTRTNAAGFIDGLDPATLARPRQYAPVSPDAMKWLEQHSTYTPKSLAKFRERAAASEAKKVPARWTPTVVKAKQQSVRGVVETHYPVSDPRLAEALSLVDNSQYGLLQSRGLITAEQLKTFEAEAIATIADLRARGVNPEYVHHVSTGQAAAMGKPRLSSIVPKPSQLADRINDWTPTTKSLSVSLSHQGMELAKETVTRAALDEIKGQLTHTVGAVREMYWPMAERSAVRRGITPGDAFEKILQKEFVRWSDAEGGFVAGSAKSPKLTEMNRLADSELLIPRHLADALHQIAKPPVVSKLFDPLLNVFRYAVLPFSPRFQVNNIGGGIIGMAIERPSAFLSLREGATVAWGNYKVARQLAKGMTGDIPADTAALMDLMPASQRASMSTLEFASTPESIGKIDPSKLVRFKAAQQSGKWMMQAGNALKRGADWSFGVNQLVDDIFRGTAYFSGQKSALKAGMSLEDSMRAGVEVVNKIQPRWLEMTPMERSILRSVIPFYGFLSHVFRYAHRFPIDHPWRTSVMGAFARAELEDHGTGLPSVFASMFGLGANASGDETFIDIGAMNPFRNLGDDLTFAGFMSEINPAFKVALGQLGYDTAARGPDLYPEVEYDPKTGKFRAKAQSTASLGGQLISGFIPQASLISALIGTNTTYNEMLKSNPEAAHRMLLSGAGIPLLWRNVDVNEEVFKSELNRQDAQQTALTRALRSGDYSDAQRYPSLAPYLDQLRLYAGTGGLVPYQDEGLQAAQQSIVSNMGG